MPYHFDWSVLWTYRAALFRGLAATIGLSLVGLTGATFVGILIGTGGASERRGLRALCAGYVEICRDIPLLVHIYFWYFGLTTLRIPNFWCAALALTFYSGAFMAEVVRAGIQSVPGGQKAAGLASGLSVLQTFWHIVYPQALRTIAPSLAGIFSQLIKDSSLASVIAVAELTFQAGEIEGTTFRTFEAYIGITGLYFMLVTVITRSTFLLFHRPAVDMTERV